MVCAIFEATLSGSADQKRESSSWGAASLRVGGGTAPAPAQSVLKGQGHWKCPQRHVK